MTQTLGVLDYTIERYHSSAGISRSKLWTFKQLPYKFWYEHLSGQYEPPKISKAFYLGSLVHTLVLEPDLFKETYCIKPELEKLPPAVLLKEVGKEHYDNVKAVRLQIQQQNALIMAEFEKNQASKIVVNQEDLALAESMKAALLSNPTVTKLLKGALVEKSIYWVDKHTGLVCKARPDIWKGKVVADLKTVADASYRGFQKAAYQDGYFLQAAMMYEALKSIGEPFEQFVFVCVEKTKPHCTALYLLDEEALQYGLDLFHALLSRMARCFELDFWPHYEIKKLFIPSYATLETEE